MLTYRTEWPIFTEDGLDYADEEIEVTFDAWYADPEVGPAGICIEIEAVTAVSGRVVPYTQADLEGLRHSIREDWKSIIARESGY